MKIKICRLCVVISSIWLLMQVGIVSGSLISDKWLLFSGILMGGSVVGIAYQKPSLYWKWSVVTIGVPLAYIFLTHIGFLTIVAEIVILLILTSILFVERKEGNGQTKEIEEKLKNCC